MLEFTVLDPLDEDIQVPMLANFDVDDRSKSNTIGPDVSVDVKSDSAGSSGFPRQARP